MDIAPKKVFLGTRLVPLSRDQAICFVCTYDTPFLLSKVAGCFTIHDCDILEADIKTSGGLAVDLYKLRIPLKYEPPLLETMLHDSLLKALRGDAIVEEEIFDWENKRGIIRDRIVPRFRRVVDDRAVLSVKTSNKKGLLHKIAWALSLSGMDISKAAIDATESAKAEDVFWIRQRNGERITPLDQDKIAELLKIIVEEGSDPVERRFKKEINMIYRQQLRKRGSGFRTAQLYANAHLRLIEGLFERIKGQLGIADSPVIIGVYGGMGSGAIGFTSDVDCIFLYDGAWSKDYEQARRRFIKDFRSICDLDLDESLLANHINCFHLGKNESDGFVSYNDFFDYILAVERLFDPSGRGIFAPQLAHYPWAFSIRFIGRMEALRRFKARMRRCLPHRQGHGYQNVKVYVVKEKRRLIRSHYIGYLEGRYFPEELSFLDSDRLKRLYRLKSYESFIESINPYDAVKYVFRRGVFPLLHLRHHRNLRSDMSFLRNEYRGVRSAMDFMLKSFNVRKTLFIMGKWDLRYFLAIMCCESARDFCGVYMRHQKTIARFVRTLTREERRRCA
jgi:hypothetical protein